MTEDKGILIKNVFYMLSYAFKVLKQTNYDEVEAEEFENIEDLFAAILAVGIAQQLKHGLYREYNAKQENLFTMRGKLGINGTIQNRIQHSQQLFCEYDELSENNVFNQILKTSAYFLMRNKSVSGERKKALKKVMMFFSEVDPIDRNLIKWNMLRYQRNNQNYVMLMNISYFVLHGLLQTTEEGALKVLNFSEENMARLFERFVLEYYRYHHNYLDEISAMQIKWNLDEDTEESMIKFLPRMQTDITLQHENRTLIIDTKYYMRTMQSWYDSSTIHSNNLYQIYTYVKNKDVHAMGNVSGMLLYAKTEEAISPDCEFSMGGNRISVKTLDLNTEFKVIAKQLDRIVELNFRE